MNRRNIFVIITCWRLKVTKVKESQGEKWTETQLLSVEHLIAGMNSRRNFSQRDRLCVIHHNQFQYECFEKMYLKYFKAGGIFHLHMSMRIILLWSKLIYGTDLFLSLANWGSNLKGCFLMLILIFLLIFCRLDGSSTRELQQPQKQHTNGVIIYSDQIEDIRQTHCEGRYWEKWQENIVATLINTVQKEGFQ